MVLRPHRLVILAASALILVALSTRATEVTYPFEIKGQVTGLTGAAPTQKFKLRGLSFTTDASTRLKHLPTGLANGAFIEVKTRSVAAPFLATKVSGLSESGDDDHEHHRVEKASVEGLVTALTGTTPNFSFTLEGRRVVTSSATLGVALVAPNVHLEAKGPVDSTGTITATKIETEDDD